MIINIEGAFIISRRRIISLGGLEPEARKADPAHVVYSFCMAHIFQEKVKAPKAIWDDLKALGIGDVR